MTRIAITGLGAQSGFGDGAERLWRGLVAGERALQPPPAELDLPNIGPLALAPRTTALDAPGRTTQLAVRAAEEAWQDAGRPPTGARVGVTCGTTLGDLGGWMNAVRGGAPPAQPWGYAAPTHAVAAALDARGPVETLSVACASGNVALGNAMALLRQNLCDMVIAGGVDTLQEFVVAGFAALKAMDTELCRPFDRTRRGLNLGEGACFLVLETEAHARRRGARVRAWLDGFGLSADAVHMTGPDREGGGAARAMAAAIADAGLDIGAVDHVSAHGTATLFNDQMEAKALERLFGARARSLPVTSLKGALGHTLGAAGVLEALAAVRTLETGLIPITAGLSQLDPQIALDVVRGEARQVAVRVVLSSSSGFGDTNAAVLLSRAEAT